MWQSPAQGDAPRILERRRIVIADPEIPGSKQPYHAAAGLPLAEAGILIHQAVESSRALALEAISGIINDLRSKGHNVTACAVVLGSGKALPPLEKILSAHSLLHTAEGEMFREALLWAATNSSLPVLGIPQKALDARLLQRIDGLGKLIGPPWTQDQKYAAIAAFAALQNH